MLIELLAAILMLAVGVLATLGIYGASAQANRVSELHSAEIHLAQGELERVESLSYGLVGLTSAPATSSDSHSPGFYVSGAGCPTFRWNQSSGGTGTDPLVVNGCSYVSTGVSFSGCSPQTTYCNGTVVPSRTVAATATSPSYTINDYITWSQDPVCVPTPNACPRNYDYKRVTIEVTNGPNLGGTVSYDRPINPVLVSGMVTDPHAIPLTGNPNVNNPLNNPGTTCTDTNGNPIVPCNLGLGNQTANTWWLTDTIQQTTSTVYSAPTADDACMHYTDQLFPMTNGVFSCGGTNPGTCTATNITGCPRPDLLWSAPPTNGQEYNFSPNLSSNTAGRAILRDSNATGSTPATACAGGSSKTAQTTELWATRPLTAGLTLSGNGGMTLYTSTLHGLAASVTLCVGVYVETPVTVQGQTLLDPLNALCGTGCTTDSVRLGVAAYTMASWPAVPSPISFTFSKLFGVQGVAAGTSLAVRVWVTASSSCGGCSGDDIVLQHDAGSAQSSIQLDSQ